MLQLQASSICPILRMASAVKQLSKYQYVDAQVAVCVVKLFHWTICYRISLDSFESILEHAMASINVPRRAVQQSP